MRANTSTFWAIAFGVVVGGLGVASIQQSPLAKAEPTAYGKPISGISAENMAALRNLDASFASLAEYIEPSVVHIRAESNRQTDVFGRRMGAVGGEGSGVIFRPDGWIVTNDHVVGGYERVTVVLNDGREYKGEVVRSAENDLAVVKIDATGLQAANFGDSALVRPGQFAMAVGSPFGLENSVTVGHVSATGRQSEIPDARAAQLRLYNDLIQTDAAINMGNSGGPLVNVDGQVIGINSAIYSGSGGSVGIGFAIPANLARKIAENMIANGKVVRGFLGVVPENLRPYQRKELKVDAGAIVADIPNDGPAAVAGLKKGDVIVQVGSQPVRTQSDVRIAMYDYKPGSTVRVDFVRDGQRRSVDVKVAAPKAMPAAPAPQVRETPNMDDTPFSMPRPTIPQEGDEQGQVPRTGKPRLGVQIETLTDALRKQFKLPAEVSGVVITAVEPGSVADRQGWTAGVVLLRVGGKTITRAQDVSEALAGVKWGDQVQIATLRMQGSTQVAEDMPVTFR